MFSDWRATQRRCQGPPASLALCHLLSLLIVMHMHVTFSGKKKPGFNNLASYLYLWTSNYVMITIVCLTFNVFLTEDY